MQASAVKEGLENQAETATKREHQQATCLCRIDPATHATARPSPTPLVRSQPGLAFDSPPLLLASTRIASPRITSPSAESAFVEPFAGAGGRCDG